MSRRCEISGKGPLSGNNVSHSNKKTKRRFLPNLQKKKFWDEENQKWVTVRVSASMMKTIDKKGIAHFMKEQG